MKRKPSYVLFNSKNGKFFPTDTKGTLKEVKTIVASLRGINELQNPLLIIRINDNKIVKRYEDLTHLHKSKTL